MTDHNLPSIEFYTKSFTPLLTLPQALIIARAACATLRHGQPEACTYDTADLDQTITVLGQMLATLELGGGDHGH